MLDRLYSPHLANLQSALGRTSQRQGLLTTNLANVNVPNYKRRDVDFNITLQQEMQGHDARGRERQDKGNVRIDGNSVDLEQEIVAIAETELRFQVLTDATSKYFAGLRSAIREGK